MADHSIYERSIGRAGATGDLVRGFGRWPRPALRRRAVAALAALAGLALVASACSNSPTGPGVAGAPTTTATSGPTSSGQAPSSPAQEMTALLAYSKCMRSHGIADYPDPTQSPGGGVSININNTNPNSDLSGSNPTFQSAEAACKSLMPGGQTEGSAQLARNIAAGVKLAECMRSHGFSSFPDPNSQDIFILPSGIDTNSPTYQSAFGTCKRLTPSFQGGSFGQSGGSGSK